MLQFAPLLLCWTAVAPAQEPPARAGTWEEAAAAYDQALEQWVADYLAAEQEGKDAPQFSSAPFVPRFRALAAAGEGRAVVWLLGNLYADNAGGPQALQEQLQALYAAVRAAGSAPWVADAIPALLNRASELPAETLPAWLSELEQGADTPALRNAVLLAQAQLLAASDAAAADALRLRACAQITGKPIPTGAPAAQQTLEDLAAAVLEQSERAQSAWFQVAYRQAADGTYMPITGAPADPDWRFRPMLESLAGAGSWRARIWFLRENHGRDDEARERLRATLDQVVAGCRDWELIQGLIEDIDALGYRLGADFVEPRLRQLAEAAPADVQPGLLCQLGRTLCELAQDDAAQRERGLALLREVVQRWPASEAGKEATGALFHYTSLLPGMVCPDFEAQDVDGNRFHLSDSLGKVTVLVFWGFW